MENQKKGILTNIKIKGFKSIKEMDLDLKPLNIIIGQNGAGKSNFISIFKILHKIVNKEFQLYIKKNGGAEHFLHFGSKVTENINININFADNNVYKVSLVPSISDTFILNNETTGLKESLNILSESENESKLEDKQYVKKYLEGLRVYHFHDVGDNAPIKKTCSVYNNIFLQSQAENLPAMLYHFKKNYQIEYNKVISVIKMVAPFFQDFILEPEDKNIILRWKHTGYDKVFDVYDLSDGTLRFIALATLLLQPDSFIPNTVLIDEPEIGLHPYALKILAELFQSVAKKGKQIIATSQSIEFINEFICKDIIVADRKNETSYFKRLEEKEVKQWLEEFSIGDIWGKNIIGGTPNDY